MSSLPDHPIVAAMERDGMPAWQKPAPDPICPVCGKFCDTLYQSTLWQEIVGCENCITSCDAYEETE